MIEDIDNYLERPRTQPVKNYRARVKVYEGDVIEINPQLSRESNRKIIKKKGASSFYKSEGEKESSYSIHINVDANDPDPVATMQEQFSELVKGELKSEPKLQVKGKLLYDDSVLQVYLNKTTKMVVLKTTIPCGPTIERELLRLQSVMGSVIAQHYSEILKVFNLSSKQKESTLPTDKEIIDLV